MKKHIQVPASVDQCKSLFVLPLPLSINTCSCGLGDRDLSTAHLLVIEGPACSFTARQVRLI